MLFYAAALQTLNYDWDTLRAGVNQSRCLQYTYWLSAENPRNLTDGTREKIHLGPYY